MKFNKTLIIVIASAIFFSCGSHSKKTSNEQVFNKLNKLVDAQDYFKLKETFNSTKEKLSNEHTLYFRAIISNVFNNAEDSNVAIKKLINNHQTSLNDTMLNKLYSTRLLNHLNLYEYGEAAKTSEYIQNNFSAHLDSADLEMYRNELNIWRSLSDVPKQQIEKTADATIPMVRDKVGLLNIDVTFGDTTLNLLFDTGANFSAIKRSLVDELGLNLIEADFYVTAATGIKVDSDIAIAEEFTIGDITFNNVVFLILNDKDVSFPHIDYYVNGVIGFPTIEALDEIQVSKDNQIMVPNIPTDYGFNNFALDGLMPIIAGEYQGDTLRFHLDTGATNTSLFPQFYKDYKQEIEQNYQKVTFHSGSAGGMLEFNGYVIPEFNLKIADSYANLDSIRLHIENIGDEESNFHGNFGQDYIKQFDEMILSFKYSSVLFR